MKKILLFLAVALLVGNTTLIKAQCYGTVHFDNAVGANGNDTFRINTSYCKELIMISYDGWPQPGSGPVTVDGNPATHIVTGFDNNNSGIAETYAYIAPASGSHKIFCTETNYSYPPYGLNFAATFYVTGTGNPLSIASLTSTVAYITCTTGGTVTGNITTSITNSMIYCNWENNNGQNGPFTDTWTGATALGQLHEGNGIDASHAYEPAAIPGVYTFTVTNNAAPNNGCGGLVLVLVDIPPPLCGGGGNLTVTVNQTKPTCGLCNGSINLNVTGGASPYTYNWSPNVSSNASANNLCTGIYTITVTDAACHDTTVFDTLPPSVPPLTLRDTLTQNEKCFGDCNGSTTVAVTGGTSPYNYSWAPASAGTNATAQNLCAGVYTVTVNDGGGCSATMTATITQPTQLNTGANVQNVLCFGGTGSITATPTGGTPNYTYLWNPSAQTNKTATGLTIGTYSIAVTDARGCTASTSALITQPSALSVTLSGPSIICLNFSGTLTANPAGGTSPYAYTWYGQNVNKTTSSTATINAATQTDTVKVTDANGCTATGQITVTLGPPIYVSVTGPTSICQTLSTTLCGYVQGGTGGNMYSWLPGGAITPCITVSPSATTIYTLTVTDNCGTVSSGLFTLRVNPLPATAFTSSLTQGCAPLCVQFYNTTTLAQGNSATYLWTFGNGDSSKVQNPIYCYPDNGTFSVGLLVISDSGCSSNLNKTNLVTAFAKPNGEFTYTPKPVNILTPTVQFVNQTTDPYNIIYWNWNFGDASDSVSNLANPLHTYKDTGRYCINMVSEDEHGCMDTVTNCLVIEPNFTLYIPSAFTPNGDEKNDVFKPVGQYVKSFEMYIFDRWGMQLYHTTDITQGWNGTVGGGPIAQEDTYVYRIVVTDPENKQHTYIGNVTLIK